MENREDKIYNGICKTERAFSLTKILLDYGFNEQELTAEQVDTLRVRSKEIGDLIFIIRDCLVEVQDLLDELDHEDTAPKVENSDLREPDITHFQTEAIADIMHLTDRDQAEEIYYFVKFTTRNNGGGDNGEQ